MCISLCNNSRLTSRENSPRLTSRWSAVTLLVSTREWSRTLLLEYLLQRYPPACTWGPCTCRCLLSFIYSWRKRRRSYYNMLCRLVGWAVRHANLAPENAWVILVFRRRDFERTLPRKEKRYPWRIPSQSLVRSSTTAPPSLVVSERSLWTEYGNCTTNVALFTFWMHKGSPHSTSVNYVTRSFAWSSCPPSYKSLLKRVYDRAQNLVRINFQGQAGLRFQSL